MTTPKQALEAARKCIWSGGDSLATVAIIDEALASLQGEDAVERVALPTMRVGDTYNSRIGPVTYLGLDYYYGETTHKFEVPGNPSPHYERPGTLRNFLATGLVPDEAAIKQPAPWVISYTNYRGETSVRRIVPISIRFGSTEWHPEPQWLLLAWDDDKQDDREFALKDFGSPETAIRADEREKCAKVAVARSDAVMAEAEAAHDDDNYDLYERLECEAGNYMDIAAAIRAGDNS